MTCDIRKARTLKTDLEHSILRSIKAFEEETGLQVTDIWTSTQREGPVGQFPQTRVAGVNINIGLESRT